MKPVPNHIREAAKKLAAEAPEFTAEQLAAAYQQLGVGPDSKPAEIAA